MRRVLLLVCLIVSVVELDWERQRIYLLSSIASLLLVFYSELMHRPQAQVPIETALKTGDEVSAEAYVAASPTAGDPADYFQKVEPTSTTAGEVAPCTTTQADHPERSRLLDCA